MSRAPIAAIDLGSNTVHLLVARPHRRGPPERLESESAWLELGAEVRDHGRIRPAKERELRAVLRAQLRQARQAGCEEVLVAGTGALRRAHNGREVARRLEKRFEIPVRMLGKHTEGRLTLEGTRVFLDPHARQLLVDSGGASTELVYTRGRRALALASVGVGGSLLSTELTRDPPRPLEWAALGVKVERALAGVEPPCEVKTVFATGGAAHAIEELLDRRGKPIRLKHLEHLALRLLEEPSHALAEETGLPRRRAETLAASALVIYLVLRRHGLGELRVLHAGLREGMVLAWQRAGGNWWRPG